MLRGLAALMVVFHHTVDAIFQAHKESVIGSLPGFRFIGSTGVDIFFVVSGFIMVLLAETTREGAKRSVFLLKRVVRIVPLYWLYTTVALALAALPFAYHSRTLSIAYVLKSYFFIPGFDDAGNLYPMLFVGWTLNFEVFFYLVFALALTWKRPAALLWISLGFAVLVGFRHHVPKGSAPLLFYSLPIILEFCFGMAAGWIFCRYLPRAGRWPYAALGIVLAVYVIFLSRPGWFQGIDRTWVFGIPAFLLVLAVAELEGRGRLWTPKPLVHLGNASYSIYLTHTFCALALHALLVSRLGSHLNHLDWLIFVAWPLFCLPGLLSYRYLEAPITAALQARIFPNQRKQRLPEPAVPAVSLRADSPTA